APSAQLEQVVASFERAWREGRQPAIDAYLPPNTTRQGRLLLELVHCDLEFRLKGGEAARVESYLERYPEIARDPARRLDLIRAECRLRRRRESGLPPEEYLKRFPQQGPELLRWLQEAPGSPGPPVPLRQILAEVQASPPPPPAPPLAQTGPEAVP